MDVLGELTWRGLIYDKTEGLPEALSGGPLTVYSGFDPTAASLHVGHLLPMMALARLQQCGHTPIAVVGGGTGLIGDPSGKSTERTLLDLAQVQENVDAIRTQLARFLEFDRPGNPARLVNNAEWLTTMTAMEFLRDVGKHFTVNAMLAKESVRRRLESEEGISYTEFSYSLLQAYDFLVLHDRYRCTWQIGGSDQWGNIVSGCDLIRRLRAGTRAHGLVMPLLTTAAGVKFGKTEGGTVWLDPAMTSPYEFYQFWFNSDDRDVERHLKFFTFLDAPAIAALVASMEAAPERREAQRALAREVTRMVHGEAAVAEAERASERLFAGDVSQMSVRDLEQLFPNVPSATVPYADEGWRLVAMLTDAGVTTSRGEATRLIRSGGIYVNDRRVTDERHQLQASDAIEGRIFVVRKGKRENFLIRVADR
jgi:tyrosyl-tRNA synthetase